jgi:hypothetical protein
MKINVYPNPVKDMATVAWQTESIETMVMTLIDINGKTLFQKITPKNSVEMLIDLTPYPDGIYLMKISTLTGKPSGTFKIQKTN